MAAILQPSPTQAALSDDSQAVIRIAGISHDYGQRMALDDVTFAVGRAEICGLLGPNGSGKTSLFRILSTLMLPSSGSAMIMGHDVARQPNEVRRQIGVVFQAQSVDVKLSAFENLRHQGHLYGLSGTPLKARVLEMLERVGLSDRANERVETFSGGMQRRVELAKGLLHRPSVLLLDEPTTGLDPGARRDVWKYLDVLRRSEAVSILVTTHLMEEAERCDRLAILNTGKLVALGAPAELKAAIGGDVITLESANAAALAEGLRQRFRVDAIVVNDENGLPTNRVRLEIENGHRFVTDVVEAFRQDIASVFVSKPSLEDVFISRTGHRFWYNEQPSAKGKK